MGKLKHYQEGNSCYFITTKTLRNQPIFLDVKKCDVLLGNIYHFRQEGFYFLLGFVIMPDHLHLLIVPQKNISISRIMQSIKGNTSWMINKQSNSKGSLWQKDYHDHMIRNHKELYTRVDYIHGNPVKAGLIIKPEDWLYSSANPKMETDFNIWVT